MSKYVNLTIRARLLLGFSLAALLTLAVAVVAILAVRSLGQSLSSTAIRDRLLETGAIELRLSIEQESSAVRGYLLTGNTDFLADFASAGKQYADKLAQLVQLGPSGEVAGLLADVGSLHSRYVGIANEQSTLRDMGFSQSAVFLWQTQGNDIKSSLDTKLLDLITRQEGLITSHTAQAHQQQNQTLAISLALVLVTWGAAILGWRWISQGITKPIKQLLDATRHIGMGKLDTQVEVSGHNEFSTLGAAMNQMSQELIVSREKARELAASEERTRLARDLHDAVSQTLFSATLIAEVLPRLWDKNEAQARARLEEVRQLTRGALAEMRTLLFELKPAALADAELRELLHQLGDSMRGRSGVPVLVEVEGEGQLPPDTKVALYRIAQEALNNVTKHSAASHARVELRWRTGGLELCVADDGKGFDATKVRHGSLGLGIMRERAKEIDATLEIRSSEGGTEVSVVWPAARK